MSELPPGWEWTTIGDLLAPLEDGRIIHQGWSPKCETYPAAHDAWGVLKTTAIQPGSFHAEHNKALPSRLDPRPGIEVQSGDHLLTCAGPRARCGVACLVKSTRPRLMMSGKMYRFRVNEAHVSAKYLDAYLQSARAWLDIDVMKTGGSDSGLNLTQARFRELTVPLAPRDEQERIVAAIEEHLSRLDAADSILTSAEEGVAVLAKAGVRQLFESRPWLWKTLGEIAEIRGGVTKDSKSQSDPSFVEVPYLRVANVQRGRLDLSDVTTIRVHPDKANTLRLEPGDVLLNEGGDRDKLGRGWVWEGQVADCIHQNHVFRARLNDDFDPYFVSTHANTWGQAWFEEHGRQTTNLASINLGTLKQLPVPAPPRSEQEAIVAELKASSEAQKRLLASSDHAHSRARSLRRSILAAAFSGQLVPQDSDDEPAWVLLDRIRAERAAAAPTKRTRKVKAS